MPLSEADKAWMRSLGADFDHSKVVAHICSRCGSAFETQAGFDAHTCPKLAKEIIRP